jgi:long-subunit fatty acid transport protein
MIFSGNLRAQSNSVDDFTINQQLWLDFTAHIYVNDKLEFFGDTGYRSILASDVFKLIYVRPSAGYRLNDIWELEGGLGIFYAFNKLATNTLEIRPWQGILIKWPRVRRLRFNNFVRLEERIFFKTKDWSSSFDLRLRFKVSGHYNLCRECADTYWFILFYGELFAPINDDLPEVFRNQGRVGAGIGYKFSKNWRFDFLFNWQSSIAGPNDQLQVSDYVYRLQVSKLWKGKVNE